MGFVKGKLRLLRREGLRGEGGAADAAGYGLLTQAGCVEGLWEKVLKIDWPTGPVNLKNLYILPSEPARSASGTRAAQGA